MSDFVLLTLYKCFFTIHIFYLFIINSLYDESTLELYFNDANVSKSY